MRLLPRSRRGIWLLAGAVWLSACAGLWWLLPVAPRARMQLDHYEQLQGFGPDGQTAVVLKVVRNQHVPAGAASQFQLVEVPSARLIQVIAEVSKYGLLGHTRDGQTWLFHNRTGGEPRYLIADLAARTIEPLRISPPIASDSHSNGLSPNGSYCYLHRADKTGKVDIWDIAADRSVDMPVAIDSPIVFSLDESFLLAKVASQPNTIGVIDLKTSSIRARYAGPLNGQLRNLRLSYDGSSVIGSFMIIGDDGIPRMQDEKMVWQLTTRGEPFRQQVNLGSRISRTNLPYAGDVWVSPDFHEQWLGPHVYSATCAPGPETLPLTSIPEFARSPDGQVLLIPVVDTTENWLENLLRRYGMSWTSSHEDRQMTARLYGASSGCNIADLPIELTPAQIGSVPFPKFVWLPNGNGIAVTDSHDPKRIWHIWDIQPSKSLMWVLTGGAIMGTIIALAAHRRVRRFSRLFEPGASATRVRF